ncbi:MAG: hypothetical protein HUK08_03930 [Bacteroidaceae bacterium]|nr:hypothetical protein [Bacteroidaceae bacterium]
MKANDIRNTKVFKIEDNIISEITLEQVVRDYADTDLVTHCTGCRTAMAVEGTDVVLYSSYNKEPDIVEHCDTEQEAEDRWLEIYHKEYSERGSVPYMTADTHREAVEIIADNIDDDFDSLCNLININMQDDYYNDIVESIADKYGWEIGEADDDFIVCDEYTKVVWDEDGDAVTVSIHAPPCGRATLFIITHLMREYYLLCFAKLWFSSYVLCDDVVLHADNQRVRRE